MAGAGVKIQLGDITETATCGVCLQLLTDPRALTCDHTFCLVCLQGLQTTSYKKECPICRAVTVPAHTDLENLPVNRLAVELVKLVHSFEPSSQEPPPVWPTASKAKCSAREEDYEVDDLLSNMSMQDPFSGYVSGLPRPLLGSRQHEFVICDHCDQHSITGDRYKCGICDDYDLCENCIKLPRAEVHANTHIFIKIKEPRTAPVQFRRALRKESITMGETQKFDESEHRLSRSDGWSMAFVCDGCDVSPVVGTRYKCGNCADYDLCEACEPRSAQIHNPKHIFLVLEHPVGLHTSVPQLKYNFYR